MKPFSAIGSTPIAVFPFTVGLSFFIPIDLSFSIWFFYLFRKLTRIVGDALGLTRIPEFPFTEDQSTGAWVGLALVVAWTSRKYFLEQLKTARRTGKPHGDEPISTRTALIGLLFAGIFLIGFCWIANVSLLPILAYFFLFFALGFAITRVRAEAGPPSHHVFTQPTTILTTFFGPRWVGTSGLTPLQLFSRIQPFLSKPPDAQSARGIRHIRAAKHEEQHTVVGDCSCSDCRNTVIRMVVLCPSLYLRRSALRRAEPVPLVL